MEIKSEILAFAFRVLLILVTFGDAHIVGNIGNLDTVERAESEKGRFMKHGYP
jgi:hypothetical protein